jgi:hypothetical protein
MLGRRFAGALTGVVTENPQIADNAKLRPFPHSWPYSRLRNSNSILSRGATIDARISCWPILLLLSAQSLVIEVIVLTSIRAIVLRALFGDLLREVFIAMLVLGGDRLRRRL